MTVERPVIASHEITEPHSGPESTCRAGIPTVDQEATRALGVVFRSIRSDDASDLQAFHRRLSDDTVRNRFFGAHRELSDQEAHRFTSLTAGEETAVVALIAGQIVGVGRWIRLGGGVAAELAFVVEDKYQHRGIGTTLLAILARFGWSDGTRRFVADTFTSNGSMLDVFLHSPRAVTVLSTRRDGSVVHLVMRVTRPAGLQLRP